MTEAKSSAKRCKKTTFTVNQTWNSFKISQYVGMQTHFIATTRKNSSRREGLAYMKDVALCMNRNQLTISLSIHSVQ